MNTFDLTVVLAEAPGHPELEPALSSIVRSCDGLTVELLVVGDQASAMGAMPSTWSARRVPSAPDSLVPVRWGEGISTALGPVVACLSTEFSVAPGWSATLLGSVGDKVVGAAGAVALAAGATPPTTAMYLLRFAQFLPDRAATAVAATNIPGDGAMYLREKVLEHPDLLAAGFWEIEFHRRWLAAGDRLVLDRRPLVTFHGETDLRAGIALRYHHGVNYGSTMVLRNRSNFMRHVLLAPIVPLVLFSRITRRAARLRGGLVLVLKSVAPLAALTCAWSLGEVIGAIRARRHI